MAAKLVEEDKVPFKVILKNVSESSDTILRILDAMNIGRSVVEKDGVYRIFNDGTKEKIEDGLFSRKRIAKLKYKL